MAKIGDRITWHEERFKMTGPTGIMDLVGGTILDISPSGKFYRVKGDDGLELDVSASWVEKIQDAARVHTINVSIDFDADLVTYDDALTRVAHWLLNVHPDELPVGMIDTHMADEKKG